MLWLIDGYNLLFAAGLLAEGQIGPHGVEKARLGLLGRLASVLGDQAARATVVFDARHSPPGAPAAGSHRGVHVHFAHEKQEADDLIEQLIHDNASRSLTVVSNDQRLIRAAKQRDCRSISCEEFMAWLDQKQQTRRARERPEEPAEKTEGLPAGREDPLLKELADLDSDPSLGERFPFEDGLPESDEAT
jgi:predicted RNA-binding protein with PIN domain